MCRIIAIKAKQPEDCNGLIRHFSQMCRESKEYQGHGWGAAWMEKGEWREYHSIMPIWEDNLPEIPKTKMLIGHARSAFQNKDILLENTMPFTNPGKKRVFAFNGELRGVRITIEGRIGAEKIFNYVQKLSKRSIMEGLQKSLPIIEKRSSYVRAMNMIIAEGDRLYAATIYNEDPEYFTMHMHKGEGMTIVCSQPIGNMDWSRIENYTIAEIKG
jgi:predicted glutamine amidotransferase